MKTISKIRLAAMIVIGGAATIQFQSTMAAPATCIGHTATCVTLSHCQSEGIYCFQHIPTGCTTFTQGFCNQSIDLFDCPTAPKQYLASCFYS